MPKNNRVKITQSKTYSLKVDHILYIEKEAKRIGQSSAQILSDAIQLHKDVLDGLVKVVQPEAGNVQTSERPEREGV